MPLAAIIPNLITVAEISRSYVPRGFVNPLDSGQTSDLWDGVTGPPYLSLDATVSESPNFTATPTQSQVEDGSTISDHLTLKPLKLDIQGIVTDTPVSLLRAFNNSFMSNFPSKAAFEYLRKIWLNRQMFDYIGGLTIYKNMVLTSFHPTRDSKTGDSLQFTASMEQIIVVYSEVAPARKFKHKTAVPKQSAGTQTVSPVTTNQKTVVDASGDSLTGLPGLQTGFK